MRPRRAWPRFISWRTAASLGFDHNGRAFRPPDMEAATSVPSVRVPVLPRPTVVPVVQLESLTYHPLPIFTRHPTWVGVFILHPSKQGRRPQVFGRTCLYLRRPPQLHSRLLVRGSLISGGGSPFLFFYFLSSTWMCSVWKRILPPSMVRQGYVVSWPADRTCCLTSYKNIFNPQVQGQDLNATIIN